MTHLQFATMLKGIEIAEGVNIPVAYYEFEQATEKGPPFICYFEAGSDDVMADNVNYQRVRSMIVELYTDYKDFALEKKVEDTFITNGIKFSKSEAYISSEKMFQITYNMEVVING